MARAGVLVRGGSDVSGRRCDVLVVDGVLAAKGTDIPLPDGAAVLDATDLVVAPGLIDLQVNGAAGVDITAEPERLWEVGSELVRHGVTAYAPTVVTGPPEARERALAALRRGVPAGSPPGALPVGLHFEGPVLAPSHRGAHSPAWLTAASPELITGWSRDAGVSIVTVAPELPGALEVIRALVGRGVVVSLGHTAASAEEVAAAIDAGATCLTHLFNAMRPLHHREPGPVGTALGGNRLVTGVIADGHHVDPLVLTTAWRALGTDRFLSISDTTAALGMGDGTARLGDQQVVISHGAVRLHDGTLAGSASSLCDCLGVLLRTTGCSLADAVATATTTPARVLADPGRGTLTVGLRGDLVVLDHDPAAGSLRAVATVVGGRVVHDARDGARSEA